LGSANPYPTQPSIQRIVHRLDAHLLRDLGINPMDVRDAYTGRSTSILFDPIRPYDRA
jgi:hypothetical protein